MILGGHIVVRADGGPVYGYSGTISVYPKAARARLACRDLGGTVAAVELRILPPTAGQTGKEAAR